MARFVVMGDASRRAFDRLNPGLAAQGALAETFPRMLMLAANTLMIGGEVYYTAIQLFAGWRVATVSIYVGAAGSGMTLSKVGLYSKAGVRLALSADQGVAWETVGVKTVALAAPYVVPTNDLYYVAAIAAASTSLPGVGRGFTNAGQPTANNPIGSGVQAWAGQTGQADLPAPGVISGNATAFPLWAAVSG